MKIKSLVYKGLAASAIALTASCSGDFLETAPAGVLEQEAVNEVMQADPAQLQSYVTGAQLNLYCGGDFWVNHDDFGLPAVKLSTDLWGEDIAYFNDAHFFCYDYQLDNRMGSYRRAGSTWNQFYNLINDCNDLILKLKPAEGKVLDKENTVGRAILGEAYGMRAYAYFWLVNLWQHPYSVNPDAPGVPVKTEEEYRQERVPVKEVYELILSDIDAAYKNLEGLGYHNGKIGLSEYAAAGIYANVLMFTGDYENAAKYAEAAIAGGSLNSEADMLSGFNSLDMPEAIWGYNVTNETTGYYASYFSHVDPYMIGYGGAVGFRKLVASDLYNKIDANDVRKKWFGYNEAYDLLGTDFSLEESYGFTDYLQNKFRDIYLTSNGNAGVFTSAIIHTRIAEMYFVAAEAYYLAQNETKAKEVLNAIMVTRNPSYAFNGAGEELYNEICLQKRIEMWMEGCRALDAKRRGETIDRTTSVNHSPTTLETYNTKQYKADEDYRMIYHIPVKELENNPVLSEADDNE